MIIRSYLLSIIKCQTMGCLELLFYHTAIMQTVALTSLKREKTSDDDME